jgi:hypothetical protein
MTLKHTLQAEDRPSNEAYEVSCRARAWKCPLRWLPIFVRPIPWCLATSWEVGSPAPFFRKEERPRLHGQLRITH